MREPNLKFHVAVIAVAIIFAVTGLKQVLADDNKDKESSKPLKERSLVTNNQSIPMLWGVQLVGADLAKKEMAKLPLKPALVVVSDGGIRKGAKRVYKLPRAERVLRPFKLRLLPAIREMIPDLPEVISIPNPFRLLVGPFHPTHGTHVAGIIGTRDAPFGLSGAVEIADLDIFQGQPLYTKAVILHGYRMLHKKEKSSFILNMSHGFKNDPELKKEIQKLINEKDVLAVAAAGNDNSLIEEDDFLSSMTEVVTVAAFGLWGSRASFSSYGEAVDITAPGEKIVSLGKGFKWKDTELEVLSGTSMAAPMVSGALANLRAILPQARGEDLRTLLYKTAIDLGEPGKDSHNGHGLLNALKATMIAANLVRAKRTTAEEIHKSLSGKKVYALKGWIRLAKIERRKAGINSPQYLDLLRREVLLEGRAKGLKALGKAYQRIGFKDYGFGLEYASYNIRGKKIASRTAKRLSLDMISLQKTLLEQYDGDTDLFASLANADLLLSVYENLPSDLAQYSPTLAKRMTKIAPEREWEFLQLLIKKMLGFSGP